MLILAFLPSLYAVTLIQRYSDRDLSAHIPLFAHAVMVEGITTPHKEGSDTPTVIRTDWSSPTSVTVQTNSAASVEESEGLWPLLDDEVDCGFDYPCDSLVVQFTTTLHMTQFEFDAFQGVFKAAVAKCFDIETFEVSVLSVEQSIATTPSQEGTIEAVIQFTAIEAIAEMAAVSLSTGSLVVDIMGRDMDIGITNVSTFTAPELFTFTPYPVKNNDTSRAIPEIVELDPLENEEWRYVLYT
jgi:hypothetical protein